MGKSFPVECFSPIIVWEVDRGRAIGPGQDEQYTAQVLCDMADLLLCSQRGAESDKDGLQGWSGWSLRAFFCHRRQIPEILDWMLPTSALLRSASIGVERVCDVIILRQVELVDVDLTQPGLSCA